MDDAPWCQTGLVLSHLHLCPQRASLDTWSRRKPQPITLSLRLSLASFATAAATDSLDASTLHYGVLAKTLSSLAPAEGWETLDSLARRLAGSIVASPAVKGTTLTLHLPKAILLGDGVEYTLSSRQGRAGEVLHLGRITLPVVVGLNPHERLSRQPLVISVWVYDVPGDMSDSALEIEALVETEVGESKWETLEGLVLDLLRKLEAWVETRAPDAGVRIKVEKPRAIGNAEAPGVEAWRDAEERRRRRAEGKFRQGEEGVSKGMRVVRPYV